MSQSNFLDILRFLQQKKQLIERLIKISETLLVIDDENLTNQLWQEHQTVFSQFKENEKALFSEIQQHFNYVESALKKGPAEAPDALEDLRHETTVIKDYPTKLSQLNKLWLDLTGQLEEKWQREKSQLQTAMGFLKQVPAAYLQNAQPTQT